MRAFLNLLICLALGLVGFVAGKSKYDDDVWFHHGKALVEVWMGRTAVSMGDLTNQDMYDAVWKALHDACPPWSGDGFPFMGCKSTAQSVTPQHEHLGKVFKWPLWLTVHALYWSEYERTLLIHTMADTMRHVVSSDKNAYDVPGQSKKFAMGPDFIRINLPVHSKMGFAPYMDLRLSTMSTLVGPVDKQFYCCPSRAITDKVLDDVGGNYTNLYPGMGFGRDVRCLIDHMLTCEDCGPKCDACGYSCPNVCPKGKC